MSEQASRRNEPQGRALVSRSRPLVRFTRAGLGFLLLVGLVSPLLAGRSSCPCCAVVSPAASAVPPAPAGEAVWPYLLVTAIPFVAALAVIGLVRLVWPER